MADSTYHARFLNPWKLHLEKLAIELKCPLCLSLFNEPMVLPCDHIFCKSCIMLSLKSGCECVVCKSLYSDPDIRAAPHMKNMVTIYKSMEANLDATLNHSDTAPQLSSSPRTEKFNKVTRGLNDDSNDHHSGQNPQKYPSKRPKEEKLNSGTVRERTDSGISEIEEHHVRVLKRQRKINNEFLETSGKADVPYPSVGSKFVESPDRYAGQHTHDEDKTICAFCQSSKLTEESGSMLHFANGKQVVVGQICRPNVIHVHSTCIEWAPQVYYSDEILQNLEREVARGAKLKCSSCGVKGAVLGCYETKCRRTYHVSCAAKVVGCRWDSDNYLLLCPSHFSMKFPDEDSAPQKRYFHKEPLPAPMTAEQVQFWDSSPLGMRKWVLCGSALSAKEKFLLVKFASMSGITVSKVWKPEVTHIIAATDANGVCCRTLKVLMGILHGKWILTTDWINACMDVMRPVNEEPYEVTMDNHGCCNGPKTGRLRLLKHEPKLLNGFHFYFSDGFSPEYMGSLQDLVIAGGGSLLNSREEVFKQAHEDPLTIFIVYNVDPPEGCKLGEEISLVLKRLREAQELAEKIKSRVIRHTALLQSIAGCKLQPSMSSCVTID